MFIWQLLEKHSEEGFEELLGRNPLPILSEYLKLTKATWYLPEGIPEGLAYKTPTEAVSTLIGEWKVIRLFHSDANGVDPFPTVTKYKRESKFIDTLENIPKIEAEFLIAIKDKTVFDRWPKLSKPI